MNSPVKLRLLLALAPAVLAAAADTAALRVALTHHVSFDAGLEADFSRGDRTLYTSGTGRAATGESAATTGGLLHLRPGEGRFGGALRRSANGPERIFYKARDIVPYRAGPWSGTVSIWLRIDPDAELEPGYCDPVQITGGDNTRGFIFLEWSRERPRRFRYALRPENRIWNPRGLPWEDTPASLRPMVEVAGAPFSRTRWTHVVFTFDRLNDGDRGRGRLFLDGEPQGEIAGWEQAYGWDPEKLRLVLGAAYIGDLDDLAVFDRALTAGDVRTLFGLRQGVREIHPSSRPHTP